MAEYRLRIEPYERVIFVGKTGSGKTYLARHLAQSLRRLVVFDPKGMLNQPGAGWNLVDWSREGEKALLAGENIRLRVPAPLDGDWSPYLLAIQRAQLAFDRPMKNPVTLYMDEVYGVVPPGKRPQDELVALYTRGREWGIGVWGATQRPVWVPLFVKSEAEWTFMFRLQLPDDQRSMAGIIGPAALVPIRDEYGFYIYNQLWNEPLYTPLLENQRVAVAELESREAV